jgi:hypothetical protein
LALFIPILILGRTIFSGIESSKEFVHLLDQAKIFAAKDLYEKKIESPFFPKATDNYDKKYCEQVEKIGLDTKERYYT